MVWLLVKFEVYFDGENWCARGIGVGIFTQGKTLDELTENIKEATSLHFEDIGDIVKGGPGYLVAFELEVGYGDFRVLSES